MRAHDTTVRAHPNGHGQVCQLGSARLCTPTSVVDNATRRGRPSREPLAEATLGSRDRSATDYRMHSVRSVTDLSLSHTRNWKAGRH